MTLIVPEEVVKIFYEV